MKALRYFALAAGLLALGACASPAERRVIRVPGAPPTLGPFSPGIQVGNRLYVSGQLGIDPATGQLVPGGVEAEARQALMNVQAIVEAAGFTLGDVVQVQVFAADIADYAKVNAIYVTFFTEAPPARAFVQVAALPRGGRVEVVAVAERGGR